MIQLQGLARIAQRVTLHAASLLPRSTPAAALMAATLLAALPYAPDAEARGGGHRLGFFAGGVVVGAVLAPRYVYSAPYYYPPPVYYAPYPPAVTYVQPPVVIQQAAPTVISQAAPAAAPPPVTYSPPLPGTAPSSAAATAAMSIEDRLRRLRSMCEQGLFTDAECRNRREQILQEM